MGNSAWMAAYEKSIRQLLRDLEYFALQGSSDGKLNLRRTAELGKCMFAEIQRLETENSNLKNEMDKILDKVNLSQQLDSDS